MSNVKDIRRENMRFLAKSIGGITPMSERLGKSQSQISHLIGTTPIKNIGDKIAAQIEIAFNKPRGWMDKEHSRIEDRGSGYTAYIDKYPLVPLISWDQVPEWQKILDHDYANSSDIWLPTISSIGKRAFALKISGDSMESPSGISFPDGCIIILDPDFVATNRSFVVATGAEQPTFKQFILDGGKRYLKPLNPRYPITELTETAIVYGIVRQMLMQFD